MSRKLKEQILNLRASGLSYNDISIKLNCNKSLISYHCGNGQKEKTYNRSKKYKNTHPFTKKIESFSKDIVYEQNILSKIDKTTHTKIYRKILQFSIKDVKMKQQKYSKPTFTVQDVIDKYGPYFKCYLTGRPINISDTKSYHFDHIIPRSKGGTNEIDNLGIACKDANLSKHNLTKEEFVQLCREVIALHDK